MLYVGLMIKLKVGIPESFKVGWYPLIITESSHLKRTKLWSAFIIRIIGSSSSFPSSPPSPPALSFSFSPALPTIQKEASAEERFIPPKREEECLVNCFHWWKICELVSGKLAKCLYIHSYTHLITSSALNECLLVHIFLLHRLSLMTRKRVSKVWLYNKCHKIYLSGPFRIFCFTSF